MAKKPLPKKQKCRLCPTVVKDSTDLAKHCLETGHQADQCCRECIRWFGSNESLAQHRADKQHPSQSLQPVSVYASHFPDLGTYTFKDRGYKGLQPPDMNAIYESLLQASHSQERLRREGYILPDSLNKGGRGQDIQVSVLDQCLPTPPHQPFVPGRKAVVLDCGMAGVEGGRSEIVTICAVDLFTGQVLVNSTVKPREPIRDWRSQFHGVTPPVMAIAVVSRLALDGWQAARAELWKHINADTVLVGHCLQNDLKALRIMHDRIFDTSIASAEAAMVGKRARRRWGLRLLCKELLQLQIRQGHGTYRSMEDAMATRELALWCLCHPDELVQWGKGAQKKLSSESGRNRKKRKSRPPRRAESHDGEEFLRWEDVVDWETWPKSPPDSD